MHTYFTGVWCNCLASQWPEGAIAGAEARWRTLSTVVQLLALMHATTCARYAVHWESKGTRLAEAEQLRQAGLWGAWWA